MIPWRRIFSPRAAFTKTYPTLRVVNGMIWRLGSVGQEVCDLGFGGDFGEWKRL
jgi:hypothetical protein